MPLYMKYYHIFSGVFCPASSSVERVNQGRAGCRYPCSPQYDRFFWLGWVTLFLFFLIDEPVLGHNVAGDDQGFLLENTGTSILPYMYLGAKHMVTGYDHLLFLVGVIFFLYRLKDVVLYVTLFAVGHSVTLLYGVLAGIHVNPYIVDAIIGLSVVYKAFDNLGGFKSLIGVEPDARLAVLVFGFFHGFGLATKLQDLQLSEDGLIINMLSFNIGVELGQILALSIILIGLNVWRTHGSFFQHAFVTNVLLITSGFILFGYQLTGYIIS